jgi:hypothetical protein
VKALIQQFEELEQLRESVRRPKRFSRTKVLACAEKRVAPALFGAIGNVCVKRHCWDSRRDFAVSGDKQNHRRHDCDAFLLFRIENFKELQQFCAALEYRQGEAAREGAVSWKATH